MVENYACADQQGAVGDHAQGKGWEIMGNEVLWNHGVGVAMPPGSELRNNNINHNGELGVGAGGGSGAVEENEIAFNVWNGTDCGWECGGAKWAQVTEWFVENNYVHDNQGDGLWADIGSEQMLFEGNRIENNLYAGLSYEISHSAVIVGNSFKGNGAATFGWGWQGQIQIQNLVRRGGREQHSGARRIQGRQRDRHHPAEPRPREHAEDQQDPRQRHRARGRRRRHRRLVRGFQAAQIRGKQTLSTTTTTTSTRPAAPSGPRTNGPISPHGKPPARTRTLRWMRR